MFLLDSWFKFMKKKTNFMFLFFGILMAGILIYQERSFIKNTFNSLLNLHKVNEVKNAPEKDILNANHQEYLDTMKDSSLGTTQHEYSTIQRIYERDKGIDVQEPMLFEGNDATAKQNIKIQILNYFTSEEISTITDGVSSVTLINTQADPVDENNQLKEAFTFLAVDAEITNIGEESIPYFSTYHEYVHIEILDANGEPYFSNQRNLFLTKDGDTFIEKTPDNYKLYDIEPDNPVIVRYVIAIPEEVFGTHLQVCALSTIDAVFPIYEDKVQLRVLTDIPQK